MDEERRRGERERKVVMIIMMMKVLQYVDLVLARMYSQFVVLVFLLFVAACETSKKMLTWYAALRVMSAIESARL